MTVTPLKKVKVMLIRSGTILLLVLLTAQIQAGDTPPEKQSDDSKEMAECNTLEDLYGDTGNTFQAAVSFLTFESDNTEEALSGFGLTLDDMKIEWREFVLDDDTTDCGDDASGPHAACATVILKSTNFYEDSARIEVTVIDHSLAVNACTAFGYPGGDDTDCDNDTFEDIFVTFSSDTDPAGEVVLINDPEGDGIFVGSIPISSQYDSNGTLFVRPLGGVNPIVTVVYDDQDDGSGSPCRNHTDPAAWGRISDTTTIFINALNVIVTRAFLTDNGDDDGFADDYETVTMQVEIANKSGIGVTDLRLSLLKTDPHIECVIDAFLDCGDLGAYETKLCTDSFTFRMAEIGRTDPEETFSTSLDVGIIANEFSAPLVNQTVSLILDLDISGGSGPTTFFESFESGFGQFTTMHLDEGMNPPDDATGDFAQGVINADGARCQYNDPDFPGSITFGSLDSRNCFPNPDLAPDAYYFDTTTDRAFGGTSSMAMTIFLDEALGYTTPLAQLEAFEMIDPINLGAAPQLIFAHQVSLMDHRSTSANGSTDRGVVQVQRADADGYPIGDWIKISPYANVYDTQAAAQYFNCMFDPIDDGSTEDDYFDPSDPNRLYGPSSTCFPEFSFTHQGDTWDFDVNNLGDASDGPGLAGDTGPGTWVQPLFDLTNFRYARLRIRFLATGLKAGGLDDYEDAFEHNPDPGDDGWWIDEITVTDTLTTHATLSTDTNDNSSLEGCGPICDTVAASLLSTPASSATPGRRITLDASGSVSNRCRDGMLQYKFEKNSGAGWYLLRDWTDNAEFVDAPQVSSDFRVTVRCATDQSCNDSTGIQVTVHFPSSECSAAYPHTVEINDGADNQCFGEIGYGMVDEISGNAGFLTPADKTEYSWTAQAGATTYEVARSTVPVFSSGCVKFSLPETVWSDGEHPAREGVFYYIVRALTPHAGSWGQGLAGAERTTICP